MVTDIGLMIGLYIITRMISFLIRKGDRAESIVVKIFAVITILVTFVCVADLVLRGQPTTLTVGQLAEKLNVPNYRPSSTDGFDNIAPTDQSEIKEIRPINVIVKYDINIYENPGFNSTTVLKSKKGAVLTAIAENKSWYKVKLGGDKFGWVGKSWVTIAE